MTTILPRLRTVYLDESNVRVQFGQYGDGSTALQLVDPSGECLATASIRLVNEPPLPADHIWVKDYSENEGMKAALVKAGVIELTGTWANAGYTHCEKARIIVPIEQ